MDSSKWILARKKGSKEGDDKYMFRLPLRALAPKGDIESYYWYFGELDRQATNDLLRIRDYPRGTFAVRINQKNNEYYSLSIINRVRTGMSHTVCSYYLNGIGNDDLPIKDDFYCISYTY